MTNALFEHFFHRLEHAVVSSDICKEPFVLLNVPPTDFKSGVHDQVFKKDALAATVAFAEGVDNIDIGIGIGDGDDQIRPVHAFEPICRGHSLEYLAGLLGHEGGLAEARVLLGHPNGP